MVLMVVCWHHVISLDTAKGVVEHTHVTYFNTNWRLVCWPDQPQFMLQHCVARLKPNSKTFNPSATLKSVLRIYVILTDLPRNATATQIGDKNL